MKFTIAMSVSYVLYVALLSKAVATVLPRPIATDELNKNNCIYCRTIAASARLAGKENIEKEEIEEQIKELCATLSPHSFRCLIQSRKLMPFVIDAATNINKVPDLCSQLSKVNCHSILGAETSIDFHCNYCEAMALLLEQKFSGQTIQMRQLAESVCQSTKANDTGKFCNELMSAENLDLSTLSTVWRKLYQELLHCKKRDAMGGMRNSVSGLSKNVTCTLCHVSMEFLELAINEFHLEERSLSLLKMFCSHLPKGLQKDCNVFVQENATELMEQLIDYLRPDHVCKMGEFC